MILLCPTTSLGRRRIAGRLPAGQGQVDLGQEGEPVRDSIFANAIGRLLRPHNGGIVDWSLRCLTAYDFRA
jgi:hypothetical protein